MQIRPWPCLAVLVMASAAIKAQGQRPSFKTGVQLVRIDVSVLDDKRQPVKGLQASEFTVLEDGRSRPIRAFEAVDHAATPAAAATASGETPTDVATNQSSHDTSRLIFILLDRSIPPERPMIMARQIADAAIDAMAPGDLAAIVTTGTGPPQNLTSDRARLHKTIAASDWSQTLSQAERDDPNLWLIKASGLLDPMTDGACLCGVCSMDTITQIANQVRDVPRRKLLLYIGGDITVEVGMRPGVTSGMACDKVARDSREKLFDALGTSGLTVHSIDPRGLINFGPETDASVVNGVENRTSADLRQQLAERRDDFMKAQGNLAVLPSLTGGRTILNSNEPFQMMPGVLHESEAYYLLAFEPIESTGSVRHNVEVKVARKGVQVHSVRYIAPPAAGAEAGTTAPRSPLERAVTALLPDASFPLGLAVSRFAGPDRRHAYVGITIDASSFAAGRGSIPLEIAIQASDELGRRVAAARQEGTVEVHSAAIVNRMAAFVELQTYLTLPPGDYELRSAVMNVETRATSSVFTHITVPAFDDAPVALSDIVFGTRENAGTLPERAPALPIVPTTARVFNAGQPAWAFVRAYRRTDPAAPRQPAVSIETSVLDAGGTRVKHQSLPEASFAGSAADVRVPLPLKGLAAGRYVLRIDATQGRAQASRAVAFEVVQAQPTLMQEHSPELDAALAAAAKYIDEYERRMSAIGAEEEYDQAVGGIRGDFISRPMLGKHDAPLIAMTRKTRANIMTISLGAQGWVSFRDVFELDGKPTRDRIERLTRILQHVDPESLQQARQIAAESAHYNLQPEGTQLERTLNMPMTALYFLRAANQARSVFRLGRAEAVAGIQCVTLQFSEQARPRLIGTSDDAPAQGTFWIDMAAGGRVLKSELRIESAAARRQIIRSQTTVSYTRIDKVGLWLATVMDDTYEFPASGQVVTGHATYSDFRAFTVTTSEGIK
jgi:VWFA-related protein